MINKAVNRICRTATVSLYRIRKEDILADEVYFRPKVNITDRIGRT